MADELSAQLVATRGPWKDRLCALSGSEFSVGREMTNSLALKDAALSRRHCLIERQNGEFRIRDLHSRNGTYVNGRAIVESRLADGDEITVGESTFVFRSIAATPSADPGEGEVRFEDGAEDPGRTTVVLRPTETVYLQPELLASQLPADSSIARNLNVLLQASRAVNSMRDPQQLQERMIHLLFEATPAERAAILICGSEPGRFISTLARNRSAEDTLPLRVSQTITRQVVQQGVAVLTGDPNQDEALNLVESLVLSEVRSLICVPLTVHDRVIGCIYLDTRNPLQRFAAEHLELATAFAGISAVALDNARRFDWLEQENERLAEEVGLNHGMVGSSPRMREVYSLIKKIAQADANVLVLGESGTGKELVARSLHRLSSRATKPFAPINCGAIPENLIESELFGHEKNAFTGAATLKKGRFEMADGGLFFLDEIGEMPIGVQATLLRVLAEREIVRVGGHKSIPINVRLVAATNRDLDAMVKAGSFRQDLLFRLNVVSITVPPLRERREDIPQLAEHLLARHARKSNLPIRPISPEAMALLQNYDWPGNVRELENAIERALVLGSPEAILPEDLPEALLDSDPTPASESTGQFHASIKEHKKALIVKALDQAGGVYTEAARLLGLHPNYLHRLIRNLDLKDDLKAPNGTKRIS